QTQAWDYLSANPDKVFTKVDEQAGKHIVRVAIADTMAAEGCVNCHNSHPDTPRKGWKLGDVRGVLEITESVDDQYAAAGVLANRIVLSIIVAGLILAALAFIVGRNVVHAIRRIADTMHRLTSNDLGAE